MVQSEMVINYAISARPKSLDPHYSCSLAQYAVVVNSFNGLVRFAPGTTGTTGIDNMGD